QRVDQQAAINAAISDLARRVDQVADQNPGVLQKLDQATADLRVLSASAASNEKLEKLAEDVRGLSTRYEQAVAESNAKVVDELDRRITAALLVGSTKAAETESGVKALGEQIHQRLIEIGESHRVESSQTENLVIRLGEQIDRRIAALVESNATKSAETDSVAKTIAEQLDRRIEAVIDGSRAETAAIEMLVKSLGEQFDR